MTSHIHWPHWLFAIWRRFNILGSFEGCHVRSFEFIALSETHLFVFIACLHLNLSYCFKNLNLKMINSKTINICEILTFVQLRKVSKT